MDYNITPKKAIVCIATLLVLSCTTSKPVVVSLSKSQKVNTDNSQAKKTELDKSNAPNKRQELTYKKTINPNLPPEAVLYTFRKNYPNVLERSWTKIASNDISPIENTEKYKVFFLLNNNKNWETYTFSGELVETKVEILVDQLPPGIVNAIKTKYPEVQILSASTYKNSSSNGSYSAVILVNKNAEPVEVILNENGSFVD